MYPMAGLQAFSGHPFNGFSGGVSSSSPDSSKPAQKPHSHSISKVKPVPTPRKESFQSLNQLPNSINQLDATLPTDNFSSTQTQQLDSFESNTTLSTPRYTDLSLGYTAGAGIATTSASLSTGFDMGKAAATRAERWGQIQARSFFDSKWLDEQVGNLTKNMRPENSTPSRTIASILFNNAINTPLVDITDLGTPAFIEQISSKGRALGNTITEGIKAPLQTLSTGKELAHASWTRSFTEAFSGNNVVSNSLSALASILFVVHAGEKTKESYENAKADGQTGTELGLTTTIEGGKHLAKAGAAWFMGDVGATLFKNMFGSEIKAWENTKFLHRFKSLPAQAMAIIGAVIFGTLTQAGMEALLPSYKPKKTKEDKNPIA
jgi:hypothetical protein